MLLSTIRRVNSGSPPVGRKSNGALSAGIFSSVSPPVDGESTDVATASFAECQGFVDKVARAQYMAMLAFSAGYSDTVQQLWWDEVDHWLDEFHENNCYVHFE